MSSHGIPPSSSKNPNPSSSLKPKPQPPKEYVQMRNDRFQENKEILRDGLTPVDRDIDFSFLCLILGPSQHTKHTEPFFADPVYNPLPNNYKINLEINEVGQIMNLFEPINHKASNISWRCNVDVCQRFQVSQHISTTKHKQNKERQNKFKQQFLASSPSTSSDDNSSTFYTDLCRVFIRADIPIFKLKNPALKDFLEQYTGKTIPEESTIRKKYVNVIYEETLTSIRQNIQDGPIWVSIDESTDADGRYVGNVIVGKLSSEPCNSFLLNCEQLDKCNHKTIAKLFNDSMNLLWPEGVKYENLFLFLSDAAPYMCKAENKNFLLFIWILFEKNDIISDIKRLKKENTEPGFELLP
ncbi:hypothetical protein QTP88_010444 [Uroleucon formosanum]